MSVYRNISTNFWVDPKVDDNFTPEDKYFYLYLLTNPHTNIAGCYEIGDKQFERELGYNRDTILRLLDRMERQHRVLVYSRQTKEVLLLNWGKYNWSKSDKLKAAVEKVAAHIKSPSFRNYVLDAVNGRLTKEESTKEENITDKQYTDNRIQITDTATDVSIGYGYPMDTLPESESIAQSCEPTLSPEPPVFVFPCIKNQTYPVSQRQIDEWAEAYPRVDIKLSIKQMIAWLNSNPSKRKTAKGCPRFINSWLGRDQDSGRNERKETRNATGSASIWDKFTV